MIPIRPLKSDEFSAYAAYFIPDYAADIASNYGIPLDAALTQAKQIFEKELPQGADTPGQKLMAILLADHHIGYLVFAIVPETAFASITDFFILPLHQGLGHGTAAIATLTACSNPKAAPNCACALPPKTLPPTAFTQSWAFSRLASTWRKPSSACIPAPAPLAQFGVYRRQRCKISRPNT